MKLRYFMQWNVFQFTALIAFLWIKIILIYERNCLSYGILEFIKSVIRFLFVKDCL